jgi:hypothetical protein
MMKRPPYFGSIRFLTSVSVDFIVAPLGVKPETDKSRRRCEKVNIDHQRNHEAWHTGAG